MNNNIKVRNLSKKFEQNNVISNLNIDFNSGKINCLFGPSGCGKSTLLNILAGLVSKDNGIIDGVEGKTFSFVFQDDRLIPWLTVEKNIMFAIQNSINNDEIQKYLDLVELFEFKDYYPYQLSGGMKRRVAIARALAYQGDILLMDEPFKGFDFTLKDRLMKHIVENWYKNHKTLIFVTHDMEEVLYMGDNIFIFTKNDNDVNFIIEELVIDIPHSQRQNLNEEIKQYREILLSK